MIILGLSGRKRSGKDTLANLIAALSGLNVVISSFSQPMKGMCLDYAASDVRMGLKRLMREHCPELLHDSDAVVDIYNGSGEFGHLRDVKLNTKKNSDFNFHRSFKEFDLMLSDMLRAIPPSSDCNLYYDKGHTSKVITEWMESNSFVQEHGISIRDVEVLFGMYAHTNQSDRFWSDKWRDSISAYSADILLVKDVRFNHEATAIKEAGGRICLVSNPATPRVIAAHESEKGIKPEFIDHTVMNNDRMEAVAAQEIIMWATSNPYCPELSFY